MKESVSVLTCGVASVLDLLRESLPHHPLTERRLRRDLLGHPGFDPALARAEVDSIGVVRALVAAVMDVRVAGGTRAQLMVMATRPTCRRQGLARGLYAEVEGELRRRGVQEIVVTDGLVPSGLDLRYQAAVIALLRRLYAPLDVGYDMTLPPDAEPPDALPLPEGYSVRELTGTDRGCLDDLCAGEFPGWTGASRAVQGGLDTGVIGCFCPAGDLAAFAGYDEYVFGPTGTAKAHRRKGLGTVVFWEAVRRIRRGAPGVPVLIGCANIMFYARSFGCPIRGVVWRLRKDLSKDPAISKGKGLIGFVNENANA